MRGERELVAALRAAIARSPVLPLALAAVAIFTWFAARNGGFFAANWYPGALLTLGLVVVGLVAIPLPRPPRAVLIAVAAFACYAAWSYLSILWSAQKADAWDGANRTALYALAFALLAIWRIRGRAALVIVAAYAIAIAILGCVELGGALASTNPRSYFLGGRFSSPLGYQNGDVALWFGAMWPCVALGSRRELHPLARGGLIAAAVVLTGLALLGQSRGWAFAAPVAALVFVALARGRVRATLTLCLVAAAAATFAPATLHVYSVAGTASFARGVHRAAGDIFFAAVVAGVVMAALATLDGRARIPRVYVRRTGAVLAAAAVLAAGTGLVVFVAHEGSPAAAVRHAWTSFRSSSTPSGRRSRFVQSLGSHRYDFWRVALGRFAAQPLAGIGADNFQEAYLRLRRSYEEPRYPHSVELRTLSQTGLVGALLLGSALVAALVAARRALRRRAAIAGAAIAGALGLFAYWLIHGSVDWLWEFPGLGAPACAMLGLAAGMLPRPARIPRSARAVAGRSRARRLGPAAPRWLPTRRVAAAIAALAAAALAISFTLPWVSALESNAALAKWTSNPRGAFDDLHNASSLNPLSADPDLIAGSIAVRLGRSAAAEHYFRDAIARQPGSEYAHLELGLLLADAGHRGAALAALERATTLNPRDDLAQLARLRVAEGRRVSVAAINREIARRASERAR